MTLSLNEVESTAKKATRGAGYPWGLAEEAGKAVRWLCAYDLDGCAILAGALDQFDGADLAQHHPQLSAGAWRADAGVLCPICAGAALSDRAHLLARSEIELANVASPALVLPFAAAISASLGQPVTILWGGGQAVVSGASLMLEEVLPTHSTDIKITLGGAALMRAPQATRATPDPADWAALSAFAHRTYAPATEESRLRGAGAETPSGD